MARDEPDTPRKVIPRAAAKQEAQAADAVGGEGEADQGTLETLSLTRGLHRRDLKAEAEENDHDRTQIFKAVFEWIAIITLIGLFLAFAASGIVWMIHLLVPARGWLSHEQLDAVGGLLTTGVVAGALADHFRRRMS